MNLSVLRRCFSVNAGLALGMRRVDIKIGAASRYKLGNKPQPLEIDREIENYALNAVRTVKSQSDIASAIGRLLIKTFKIGYNDNALIRENGEKTALEVFYEKGLDNKGRQQRFAFCSEISYLAASMLRSAGIQAKCAFVSRSVSQSISSLFPIKLETSLANQLTNYLYSTLTHPSV